MSSYDFYADMYATHSEIGYLLTLGLALLAFDGGLGVMISRWPRADVYLVPGVVAYGEVPVIWGRQPPRPAPVPQPGSNTAALLQVSLSHAPGAPEAPEASEASGSDRRRVVEQDAVPASRHDQASQP